MVMNPAVFNGESDLSTIGFVGWLRCASNNRPKRHRPAIFKKDGSAVYKAGPAAAGCEVGY